MSNKVGRTAEDLGTENEVQRVHNCSLAFDARQQPLTKKTIYLGQSRANDPTKKNFQHRQKKNIRTLQLQLKKYNQIFKMGDSLGHIAQVFFIDFFLHRKTLQKTCRKITWLLKNMGGPLMLSLHTIYKDLTHKGILKTQGQVRGGRGSLSEGQRLLERTLPNTSHPHATPHVGTYLLQTNTEQLGLVAFFTDEII